MIVKMDKRELEFVKNQMVYLGSAHGGQLFKNWDDLDETARIDLGLIQEKAECLLMEAEAILRQPAKSILRQPAKSISPTT